MPTSTVRSDSKSNDLPPGQGGSIENPNPNDVLSGRGGRINSHPGNMQFRKLVNQHKHKYLSKDTKKLDKVKIANEIVQTIRNLDPSGRFLKQDKDQKWIEIGDEKARKKAGQAMREKADETRKELQETDHMTQAHHFGMPATGMGNVNMAQQGAMQMAMQNQFYMQQQQQQQQRHNPGAQYNNFGMGIPQHQHQLQAQHTYSPSNSISHASNSSFPGSPGQAYSQQSGYSTMSPMQIQQYTEEQRRMHAKILKGNAVAFDREFHRLRSSESSGSRVNSLDASSGIHSNPNTSSSSSMMSALSSGVLSQNELLQLALHQQQLSNQMAVLDEKDEWKNKWDRTDTTTGASGQVGGPNNGTGTVASGSVLSGSASSGENNRRRMFQQSRGQSYLPSDLKPAEGGNQGGSLHASQLMKASIGTMGSMNMGMGSVNMSSMGMGSTNLMSSMNMGSMEPTAMSQARNQNMQRRMSALGIDPMTTSDTTLMNLLADAAATSSIGGSASTFSFMSPLNKPAGMESNESLPSETGSMNNMPPPARTDQTHSQPMSGTQSTRPVATANPTYSNDAVAPESSNIEPIPMDNNSPPETRPPERKLTRGSSSKSDVSMASNGSWYNSQVQNLGTSRINLGITDDTHMRMFTENSARSLMSDLSENISALDLASFQDTGSRRDLFGEQIGSRRDLFEHSDSGRFASANGSTRRDSFGRS